MLRLAKAQAQPQVIYASSTADTAFLSELREPFDIVAEDAKTHSVTPHVRIEKASTFNHEQARFWSSFYDSSRRPTLT